MAITVQCDCGKRFGVKDEHAGKVIRCPACHEPVGVPIPALAAIDTSEPENIFVPSPAAGGRPLWKDPIVVVGVSVPSLILVVFLGYLYKQKVDRDRHDRVYALKAGADELLKAGRTREAFDTYRAVVSEAGRPAEDDSQLISTVETARAAAARLEPLALAETAAAEREAAEAIERRRLRDQRVAHLARLAAIKGDIRGTVFVNLKGGGVKVLPGIKVSLLRAELPKSDVREVIDGVQIVAGIERKPRTGELLTDQEFAFFEESIARAQYLKSLPDDAPVDVRLFYAIAWVNRVIPGNTGLPFERVWPVVAGKAVVAEVFTSVDGKYRFEDVSGGAYYLWAEHTLNRSIAEWVVPVELSKPSGKEVDLHNNVATLIINLDKDR